MRIMEGFNGEWIVEGVNKFFKSEAEARAVAMEAERGAEFEARAIRFCEEGLDLPTETVDELTGNVKPNKAAVGKMNVVKQFLAFEAGLES